MLEKAFLSHVFRSNNMIRVMNFSSGVRTQHVFGWVSIIWFTSAVSVAVSQGVELHTKPEEVAECGGNVTLICEASSSKQFKIKLFSWLATNKTVCQYEGGQPDPEVLCESTAETLRHRLTLTLFNVMPVNQGKYLCKLRTTQGAKDATTFVTVQDCLGRSGSSINESHAECSFSEFYPSGTVHWFQGDINLTDSASTQIEDGQHGRFDVLSTLDVQKRNVSLPYTCSLWIPPAGKYLSRQRLIVLRKVTSSGSMAKLQWICTMVGIMMVKFMT